VYATDVGSDPALASIQDSGADAVYRISPEDEVTLVTRRPDLGGPYALIADENGLWITCTGSDDLLLLIPGEGEQSAREAGRLTLPGGTPRGLVSMPDGTFLISSWKAGALYRGFHDGPFEPVVEGLEAPADPGYDTRRKRVLIPLTQGHALAIFDLPPFAPGKAPGAPPADAR
jgi:hypothetical protein